MNIQDFERIYTATYENILKFVIIKSSNIEYVNDIVQDIYIELYKKLENKNLHIDNENAFVIGIAKNVIRRYFCIKKKVFNDIDEECDIRSLTDIEQDFINKENVSFVWNYVKSKDDITWKIFYLYYVQGLQINEISKELEIKESTVKTKIFRTVNEVKGLLKKEGMFYG